MRWRSRLAALVTFALPGQAVYAFDRLFAVNGTNGLPITLDQGGVFDWIDRAVGGGGDVTMLRYPVNSRRLLGGRAVLVGRRVLERERRRGRADIGAGLPGPEPWVHEFDERTGAARRLEETAQRARPPDRRPLPARRQAAHLRSRRLSRRGRSDPWRAGFVTYGIYGDGWTRPHTPATIRVFANPGQRTALKRFVTIALAAPVVSATTQ